MKNLLAYIDAKQADVLPRLSGLGNGISKKSIYQPVKSSLELNLPKVSAVIITYNEERIIAETLSRLWWCHEIIIVDSESSDRTVEICREHGCKIYSQKINGFGTQKLFGVSKASNNWILCIDADELLSDALVVEIQEELGKKPLPSAFEIPLNLVFMNKIFKHGKEASSFKIRLFNKQDGNWNGALVHESVEINGSIKKLKNKIFHYSYHSYSQFLKKIDLYSDLNAKKLAGKSRKKNKLIIILALPFNFCKYYFLDRNCLNGFQGFSWAVLNSLYHFIKYLKVEELTKNKLKSSNIS